MLMKVTNLITIGKFFQIEIVLSGFVIVVNS